MDATGDGGVRSVGGFVGGLTGLAALEVWRTLDGRGHYQAWIEVLPAALPWLVERLQEAVGDIAPPG